jgi:NTE family protein
MKPKVALVLSGGVALGAYQAGAYAALHEHESLRPESIAASSVGAVNGALIAGNPIDQRLARLQQFWDEAAVRTGWPLADNCGALGRRLDSALGIMNARLLGRPGLFHPSIPMPYRMGLYDHQALGAKLQGLLDFELLNESGMRFAVVTTEVETGNKVVFDTQAGDRIRPAHLLASCGFLPEFPAVEIDGMLLGDGGLVANTPVEEALLAEQGNRDLVCFIVELFSAAGNRPRTLEQGAARRWDLIFGTQTQRVLRSLEREHTFRCALASLAGKARCPSVTILHLSYRAPNQEIGHDKMFNFSRATLLERWEAGYLDMSEAVRLLRGPTENGSGPRGVTRSVWNGAAREARPQARVPVSSKR